MDDFKTSQTDFSLTEGKNHPKVLAEQYGTDKPAPIPTVTEPIKGEIIKISTLTTSQQRNGEHATPEAD